MSSTQSFQLLEIERLPSRSLALLLVALHSSAIACLFLIIPYTTAYVLLGIPIIGMNFYIQYRRHVRLSDNLSIVKVQHGEQGWRVSFTSREGTDVNICPDSYIHPLFIVLNFKSETGRLSVPIPFDAVDPEQHRRLRARLKSLKDRGDD